MWTLIRCCTLRYLIWVYTACEGLSVPILGVTVPALYFTVFIQSNLSSPDALTVHVNHLPKKKKKKKKKKNIFECCLLQGYDLYSKFLEFVISLFCQVCAKVNL